MMHLMKNENIQPIGERSRVLLVGRSISGYESLMASGFAKLGFDVVFVGYEDIMRDLYGKAPGWFDGVLLRRLLISNAGEYFIKYIKLLKFYNKLILLLADKLRPDLIFVVKGEAISSSTIKALTKLVPAERLSYFNPDDPRYVELVRKFADAGFRIFTACHPCVNELRIAYGRNKVVFLPFGATPMPSFSCPPRAKVFLFIGSVYPERLRIIKALLRHEYPLVIAGPGWRYFIPGAGAGVYGMKYLVMNQVVYGVINIHNKEDIGVKANMRVFEIPGAGGVEITDNPEVVSHYYTPGKELLTYSDLDELVELLRDLRKGSPEELCYIAKNGYNRTLREHTYKHRASLVLQAVGIRPGKDRGSIILEWMRL